MKYLFFRFWAVFLVPACKTSIKVLIALVSVEVSLRLLTFVYLSGNFYFGKAAAKDVDLSAYRILCIGESSTWGDGARDPDRESYPARLEYLLSRRYPETKIQVFNRGVCGVTTAELYRYFDLNLRRYQPHLVILQVGNNTHGVSAFYWSDRPFAQAAIRFLNGWRTLRILKLAVYTFIGFWDERGNIETLYGEFYFRRPVGLCDRRFADNFFHISPNQHDFFVGKMIRATEKRGSRVILCDYFMSHANEFIKAIAQSYRTPLCRMSVVYRRFAASGRQSEIISSDKWHPNSYGYSLMAEELAQDKALNEALSQVRHVSNGLQKFQ